MALVPTGGSDDVQATNDARLERAPEQAVDESESVSSPADQTGSGARPAETTDDAPPNSQSAAQAPASEAPASEAAMSLEIVRLSSPAPGTARVEGTISPARSTDVMVSSDGAPITMVTLQPNDQGRFEFLLENLAAGLHTICLNQICDRVLVAEDQAQVRAALEARIAEAAVAAGEHFDIATALPDWRLRAAPPSARGASYTRPDERAIYVSAPSDQGLDELTITVLHQLGHAVDATWMTDEKRLEFRALRSHDPDLEWRNTDGLVTGEERWLTSSEDFAEVFVAWALGDGYPIATVGVAPQPDDAALDAFCRIVAMDGIDC